MAISNEKLDIFDEPLVDHSLASLHEYTYKPYVSQTYRNSDVIRIPIFFQDVMLDISNSYVYIEGKFTPNDAVNLCYLSNNALAFLFDEIQYEMGGEKVATIQKPGISSMMKLGASYGASQSTSLLCTG